MAKSQTAHKNPAAIEKPGEMIEWLAGFGATPSGGVTRLLYTAPWLEAQRALRDLMAAKGLSVCFDEVGNLYGRRMGTVQPDSVILTGSHIDTVIEGGKFDGAYGIVASLLAIDRLFKKHGPPLKTIEVVSLAEEEGSRFPLAFWGSGWITGRYSLEMAEDLYDREGVSLHDAMLSAGFGKELQREKRCVPEAFVEIHVEQGIVLQKKKKDIGIVSDIVGQRRYAVRIKGESNHAGTTPMSMRKDAVKIMAELILLVTGQAEKYSDLVATVGKISAKPNMSNVIAGEVECTLDVRHPDSAVLDCMEWIIREFVQKQFQCGVEMKVEEWMRVEPVKLDEALGQIACRLADRETIHYEKMISGAGHDAQVFASYCPAMLMFVPSENGISHSPEEWTAEDELEKGIEMMMLQLYKLAYE
ncbi:Zn-dependent hydrolase [Jeotgalibacillus sp. S-D1]|uniref:Zn-dependent hydrolase n=1 Tax=Jeotgalibacillus sp. S-D1 TaxID=2552189 RepID=UPI00105A004D|nr:Zn-dependent hydrolase [Jeotgalibacillus sp. S-D1]TDL32665.1 Zn-dependent hydrolase [Jeotgalibacillus sp. S-D1]